MKRPQHILLVDDDLQLCSLLAHALQSRSWRVTSTGTGRGALAALAAGPADLIIVDGCLPDTEGAALIAEVRQRDRAVPIVFMSARWQSRPEIDHLTGALGVALVLQKPVLPSELVALVDGIVGPTAAVADASATSEADADTTDALQAMRDVYVTTVGEKIAALQTALRQAQAAPAGAALEEARALAHRLRGTAGTYGLADVSEVAARAEALCDLALDQGAATNADWEAVARALAGLDARPAPPRAAAGVAEEGALATARSCLHRILFVDDDPDILRHAAALGRRLSVAVLGATTAAEAVALAAASTIDAAVIDVNLGAVEDRRRGHGEASFALARRLRDARPTLPLAFISADGRVQNRVATAYAGASCFVTKPLGIESFQEALRLLFAAGRRAQPRVLVVDDDEAFSSYVAVLLRQHGMFATTLADPKRILPLLVELEPNLIILDVMMSGLSGYDVCRLIRTDLRWQRLPILFGTARSSRQSLLAAFRAGGDDYFVKPILDEELMARVYVRIDNARLAHDGHQRDVVSGLLVRTAFVNAVAARLAAATGAASHMTLTLIDLDRFGVIDRQHGLLAGERVLAHLGALLARRLPVDDLRGRWAGQQFAWATWADVGEDAHAIVDRIRAELGDHSFETDDGRSFRASFSAGVARAPHDGVALDALLVAAAQRLQSAKQKASGGSSAIVKTG